MQEISSECVEITVYGAITALGLYGSQLTTLDLSESVALTGLYCGNNQLTTLDVSKNVSLTMLTCNNNQLTTLDVSKNVSLSTFSCGDNKTITTISVASAYGSAFVSRSLADLITNATSTTGTLKIYGGDNTTVHTAATTKGWTVNTNL